jgi:hypothetical protein
VASVCQPSTLRLLIWPEASYAQNSMAAVARTGLVPYRSRWAVGRYLQEQQPCFFWLLPANLRDAVVVRSNATHDLSSDSITNALRAAAAS